ncbi:Gldg family protein [Horticoccus luteus]|uniref:Gldg family protein n=1 Tax=Horticoccus luteus TaxID=2862869 RepID=A0A8F9TVH6_9BACT|nr:GldG family protein [Horticoccus luteus]QYM79876.1 Gldg family protein [Horticoccus luteus]
MKFGTKTAAILLLLVALVLVDYLASSIPARLDATADSIYSLSPGTKTMLGKIEDPITLDLYFSKDASGLPIAYKNYAARVREMLRQYVRASHGKLTLNIINPKPDTPAEEKATAAGLQPQVSRQGGEPFYFGLVVTQADQQKTIPNFDPNREQFLEYDLSKLVYSVQLIDKPKLGLITSLPLQGTSPQEMQMMAMMHRQPQPGQFVIEEWSDTFNIVPVEATATELPAGLDVLAVVHPENLTPKLQFAIDQFLLGGKPVFLAVDPSSQYFKRQGGQQAMYGGPQPNVSSDLPKLLSAYGIHYDPTKVVGDLEKATQVQTANGALTRYPIWLSLTKDDFNAKALPTAQLNSAMFIEAGSLSAQPGSATTFTPLVQTSPQAGDVAAAALQFAQPDEIAKQITPTGKKTIAALVTGKFTTAFPDGAPKDEPAKPGEKKDTESADHAHPTPALKESKGTSTLFVVADTDWLFDDYSVRKYNLFGQTAAQPLNDNLAFAANTVEFLGGSEDLISIRGKGTSLRPFTVVKAMEVQAQQKYKEKLTELDTRLSQVQAKLTELQGKKNEGNRLVATPEIAKAIDDFRQQQAAIRGERRQIRAALREGIESLGNRLLIINLLASPLLVGLFGIWFYRHRRR